MRQISLLQSLCVRCGKPCLPGENENPEARPFRRAKQGLCGNCAVTQFFLCSELEPLRNGILRNGIDVLRVPAIQEQFREILMVGKSELLSDEIDWDTVISNWELPFPKGYKP